jgi:hypothetical protein
MGGLDEHVSFRTTPIVDEDRLVERLNAITIISTKAPKTMSDSVLRVFATLFFELSPSKHPREFSWQEFCFAMYAIGYNPSKQYGTLWNFQSGQGESAVSFQFYEPLATKKVPFVKARIMGGRLHRQFGWSLENLPLQTRHLE